MEIVVKVSVGQLVGQCVLGWWDLQFSVLILRWQCFFEKFSFDFSLF